MDKLLLVLTVVIGLCYGAKLTDGEKGDLNYMLWECAKTMQQEPNYDQLLPSTPPNIYCGGIMLFNVAVAAVVNNTSVDEDERNVEILKFIKYRVPELTDKAWVTSIIDINSSIAVFPDVFVGYALLDHDVSFGEKQSACYQAFGLLDYQVGNFDNTKEYLCGNYVEMISNYFNYQGASN